MQTREWAIRVLFYLEITIRSKLCHRKRAFVGYVILKIKRECRLSDPQFLNHIVERRFLVFSFGTLNLTFVQQLVLAMGNLNEKWALSTPVRIRSQEEQNSFIDSVVVIVSPWAMNQSLSAPSRKRSYVSLSEPFSDSFYGKEIRAGYCLVVFKREHQQRKKYI